MPVIETIDRILVTREIMPAPLITCTPSDPFGIDDPCPNNAGGPHRFIGSCGDVACVHCAKVVWS
jgi:hypothetical protein